ncbi:MAG TPA: hypothetical protein VGM11_02360 [Acidobacteriaceae bacterium]|jgi:hypothetical protein
MIDIHPPAHGAMTRRDFFIHLSIVVLGILIAIGLEQAVEQVHERFLLRTFRAELHQEREANRRDLEIDVRFWQFATAEFRDNLAVFEYLRRHPHASNDSLRDTLHWTQYAFRSEHAVWDGAQQNGLVRLMPIDEANRNLNFYQTIASISQQSLDTWNADNNAHRFDLVDRDPTHLSPQQLDESIALTEITLEKHIQQGYTMALLASRFDDMPQTITYDDLEVLRSLPLPLDPPAIIASHQHTTALSDAIENGTRP